MYSVFHFYLAKVSPLFFKVEVIKKFPWKFIKKNRANHQRCPLNLLLLLQADDNGEKQIQIIEAFLSNCLLSWPSLMLYPIFFQISKKTPRTFLFIEIQVTNYIFFGRHKMLSGWAIVSIKKKNFCS